MLLADLYGEMVEQQRQILYTRATQASALTFSIVLITANHTQRLNEFLEVHFSSPENKPVGD